MPTRKHIEGQVLSSPHRDHTWVAKGELWKTPTQPILKVDDPLEHLNSMPSQIQFGVGEISYIEGVETADIYIAAFSGEGNINALDFDVFVNCWSIYASKDCSSSL